jgi:hypothetical protein
MDKPSSVQNQATGVDNDLTAQQRRWLTHFQQCQGSGMSMAAYARSQGIQEKTLLLAKPLAWPTSRTTDR